ncbi:hypothetical protein H6G27_02590 [Nostoc linckia FACHB-104]|nr:hypothetical protein [Nostoc linckia FACHB-104]
MPTLTLDEYEVYGGEIDFITCYDADGNETDDFLNAVEFSVNLTDEGWDRIGVPEITVTKDELDGTTYELILECIQPT